MLSSEPICSYATCYSVETTSTITLVNNSLSNFHESIHWEFPIASSNSFLVAYLRCALSWGESEYKYLISTWFLNASMSWSILVPCVRSKKIPDWYSIKSASRQIKPQCQKHSLFSAFIKSPKTHTRIKPNTVLSRSNDEKLLFVNHQIEQGSNIKPAMPFDKTK